MLPSAPRLSTTSGEAVGLVPAVYTPGGALPTFADAEAAAALLGAPGVISDAALTAAVQGGHFYALFQAPANAQTVELTYFTGAPDSLEHPASTRKVKLKIGN